MNTILDMIPCVMGMPTINENLESLLSAMADHPANVGLDVIMIWAKMIGLCIALGVGANECFQMMLGRRGIDVMKLIHIVIISLCISFAGSIAQMASTPGKALATLAKSKANSQNNLISAKEEEVAKLQETYLKKVREHLTQLRENERAQKAAEADGIVDQVLNKIDEFQQQIKDGIKEYTIMIETKIVEWINIIIRYLGEILLQVSYYGILVCQSIFMHILASFAPLMFAISLSPHYKSAWSQWLSKYISISLWSFVTYVVMYYVGYIMEWSLDADISSYKTFMAGLSDDTSGDVNIGAIGMQAIGTTCMYVVGLLIGVRAIAFVPEVASWLIPGGVSSGAGSTSSAAGMAAAGMAGGLAGSAIGSGGSITTFGTQVAGTMSTGAGIGSSIAQNTGLGNAYNSGRQRGNSGK